MQNCYPYRGTRPTVQEGCFIAPGAYLIGDVALGEGVSVWYNTVLRGDLNSIRVGRYSNIQDGTIVHVDSGRSGRPDGNSTRIGEYVTIGHGCIIHACTIEDHCLIGMGAIVMDGAVIGRGSIVAAGALVLKETIIPPFSVVMGSPGRVKKTLPPESIEERISHAEHYFRIAQASREGIEG